MVLRLIRHLISNTDLRDHGSLTIRYAAVRLIPGALAILLVPLLIRYLGAEDYAHYSVLMAISLLSASLFSSIATQPMYRFASVNPDYAPIMRCVAFFLGIASGFFSIMATYIYSPNVLQSLAFGWLSASTTFFTATSVLIQIERGAGRVAMLEIARTVSLILFFLVAIQFTIDITIAASAQAISYTIATFIMSKNSIYEAPSWNSLKLIGNYGAKSALWLLLAGAPPLFLKMTFNALLSPVHAGTLAALFDISYRTVGMVNASINMALFPSISRKYDAGQVTKARNLINFAMATYLSVAAIAIIGSFSVIYALEKSSFQSLPSTARTISLLAVTVISLGAMSIAHKTLELRLKTGRMVCSMFIATVPSATIYALTLAGMETNISLILSAVTIPAACYSIFSFRTRLA